MINAKTSKEDELLTTIVKIDCIKNAIRYQSEFHSEKNIYTYDSYLSILQRIIALLKKGFNDVNQVIHLIKTNADSLV